MMNLDPRYNAFFMLTGATFFAFASGFSVCLFDLDRIHECAVLGNQWLDKFLEMGNHIIKWFFALVHEVVRK